MKGKTIFFLGFFVISVLEDLRAGTSEEDDSVPQHARSHRAPKTYRLTL
jgi:hypothetical protein